MWHNKKSFIIIALMLAVTFAATLPNGCYKASNPVHFMQLFEAKLMVPTGFGEGAWLRPPNSHPDFIQGVFSPGNKIYLGLVVSKEIKKNVTFSKYIFHNKRTGQEIEIVTPSSDLGPFQPGQITLVAFDHPWTVPEQPDVYQLRMYLGSDIVASALFEVK